MLSVSAMHSNLQQHFTHLHLLQKNHSSDWLLYLDDPAIAAAKTSPSQSYEISYSIGLEPS
jgi:hypothetical protein